MKFTSPTEDEYQMKAGQFFCGLNTPPAFKDSVNYGGLPPYCKRPAFLVDKYPACQEDWMRSAGRLASYFVPIKEDSGMWLDFNRNSKCSHHVAIVVSIQGVNAVTGLPCNDPQLEQYIETCPKHKEAFGANRFCKKCNYKWPKQNYLCTTGATPGQLWLDGFRAADGVVRQYVLTAEKARGVAKAILGEKRVFALGISFFMSKDPRPPVAEQNLRTGFLGFVGHDEGLIGCDSDKTVSFYDQSSTITNYSAAASAPSLASEVNETKWKSDARKLSGQSRHYTKGASGPYGACGQLCSPLRGMNNITSSIQPVKKLEIAAGAKLDQDVDDDPHDLTFWKSEAESILVINYCLEVDCERILAAGVVDVEGSGEGFLQSIPVGN